MHVLTLKSWELCLDSAKDGVRSNCNSSCKKVCKCKTDDIQMTVDSLLLSLPKNDTDDCNIEEKDAYANDRIYYKVGNRLEAPDHVVTIHVIEVTWRPVRRHLEIITLVKNNDYNNKSHSSGIMEVNVGTLAYNKPCKVC